MTRRGRLDTELVRRGFARSREQATKLLADGRVTVAGQPAVKAARQVESGAAIRVAPASTQPEYVSRGGPKLAGALAAFSASGGLAVHDRRALDAGASTGGFTDVLLRAGARQVVAVDVGYGQLDWSLRTNTRVRVLERTNVRDLVPEQIGGPVDVVVADLSFISLQLVLPALVRCACPDADLVLMVKPQFEVGRGQVGAGGVVRDPGLRADAVRRVAEAGGRLGYGTAGVVASCLPGPSGNVEYFLWLRAGAAAPDAGAVEHAVAEGPQ